MLENLTRYFWLLNLVTLGLIAYFVASGTGEIVAAELDELVPPARKKPAPSTRRPTDTRPWWAAQHQDGTPILRRNIFDSSVGPLDPVSLAARQELDIDTDDGELPLLDCASVPDVNVDVTSTVVSDGNPAWSFAAVSHDRESYLCRVGDEVDGRTVSHISWRYLFLRGDDDECYIDLLDEPKRKSKRKRSRGRLSRKEIKQGIKVVSPTERVVDREVIHNALANPGRFARSARVRPYKKHGEVTGFRLRRIKRNSALSLLGAKRGDIVHSVNGIALTSVDQALKAYQSLRDESQLVFEITRKGRPQELTIHVQ